MRQVSAMTGCSLLLAFCAMAPVQAQLPLPPDEDRPPSSLAPLDPGSPWQTRFDAVAATLGTVLGDGPAGQWQQYFGGQWLAGAERARIAAWLTDSGNALPRILAAAEPAEHVVLGWQPADGGAAYAALAGRPEADAIICWRPRGSDLPWPATAKAAEDVANHACVRVSYSIRFNAPQWRAFLDAPLASGD